MATKAKAKKAAPRKRAAKPKQPATLVSNHPFPPRTVVGFYPRSSVGVEKDAGREPFPTPVKKATVAKDGTLAVRGLAVGPWTAAGPVGDRWRYFDFPVKG